MRLRFIVFARTLRYATWFRGRHARVEATSMAKAILQQAGDAATRCGRNHAVGVNAESAK